MESTATTRARTGRRSSCPPYLRTAIRPLIRMKRAANSGTRPSLRHGVAKYLRERRQPTDRTPSGGARSRRLQLRRIPFPCAVVSHPLPRKRNNRDNADLHLPSQHSNRRRFFSLPYRSRQNERPDLSGNLALQGFSSIGRPDLVSTNVFYFIYSAYTVIQQRPTSNWAATLAHISLSFHLTVVFRPSTFNQDL